MSNHLVFIYGTLKSGHVRSASMQAARYIGIARTMPKYVMYQYGTYPALVESPEGKSVYGELYEVSDTAIQDLDKIECTDQGLFQRKQIDLEHITLSQLPVSTNVWENVAFKTANAYVFLKTEKLHGARDCGPIWTR